jgi:hypothetical protein
MLPRLSPLLSDESPLAVWQAASLSAIRDEAPKARRVCSRLLSPPGRHDLSRMAFLTLAPRLNLKPRVMAVLRLLFRRWLF